MARGLDSRILTTTTARYCARLNELARAAIQANLVVLVGEDPGLMSAREAARRSGIGISTMRNLLAGNTDPTPGTLIAVATGLGFGTVDQLLGATSAQLIAAAARSDPHVPDVNADEA